MGTNLTKCTSPNREVASKYTSQNETKENKPPISRKDKHKKHTNGKLPSTTKKANQNDVKPNNGSQRSKKGDKKHKKAKGKRGQKGEDVKSSGVSELNKDSTSIQLKKEMVEENLANNHLPRENVKKGSTPIIVTSDISREDDVVRSEAMSVEQMNRVNIEKSPLKETIATAPPTDGHKNIAEEKIERREESVVESVNVENTQSLMEAVLAVGNNSAVTDRDKIDCIEEPIVEVQLRSVEYQTAPSVFNDTHPSTSDSIVDQAEMERLRQRIVDIVNEKKKFEKENQELKSTCSELKTNLQRLSKNMEKEQKMYSEKEEKLQNELVAEKEAVIATKREMAMLQKELDTKTELVTKQQSEIDRLRELSSSYSTLNDVIDKELEYREQQVIRLEKEIQRLQFKIKNKDI